MSEIKVNKISPRTNCGTVTLGDSGDTIALGSGASQTGFGRTGTVDWQTSIKTSTITAVNGEGYFVNTTAGAITANLPAGTSGSIVAFRDYANTFDNNNLTIVPNGSQKINGDATNDLTVSTEGESITLVYADDTKGWLVVNDGNNDAGTQASFITATGGTITTVCTNFKVHTFTGPGTFCVSNAGNVAGSNTIDYLVVAGGGGSQDGGGGAGGVRMSGGTASGCYTVSPLGSSPSPVAALPVTATGYPVTIGAGGNGRGNPSSPQISTSGSNSVFAGSTTITSAGGGHSTSCSPSGGKPGGSGGGAYSASTDKGSGNTPPVSPPQGNDGGETTPSAGATGAGGGGAGAVGGNAPGPRAGGIGTYTNINPSSSVGTPGPESARYFGGGGAGGGSGPAGFSPIAAAAGGGGAGFSNSPGSPASVPGPQCGTANTGGGGGAAYFGINGNGGSGIVIIRYKFQ